MDVIPTSTSLTPELDSAGTEKESKEISSSDDSSTKICSMPEKENSLDVSSCPTKSQDEPSGMDVTETVNSVENVNSVEGSARTIDNNVSENIEDSDKVIQSDNVNSEEDKINTNDNVPTEHATTLSLSEISNVCELPIADDKTQTLETRSETLVDIIEPIKDEILIPAITTPPPPEKTIKIEDDKILNRTEEESKYKDVHSIEKPMDEVKLETKSANKSESELDQEVILEEKTSVEEIETPSSDIKNISKQNESEKLEVDETPVSTQELKLSFKKETTPIPTEHIEKETTSTEESKNELTSIEEVEKETTTVESPTEGIEKDINPIETPTEEIEKDTSVVDFDSVKEDINESTHDETTVTPTKMDTSEENDTSKDTEPQDESILEIKDDQKPLLESEKLTTSQETETNIEDLTETDDIQIQTNDALSEVDDQSMDQDIQQENPVFVHVSSKGVGDNEGDKASNCDVDLQNETGDESMEVSSIVEEDPIGISQETEKDDLMDFSEEVGDKEPLKVVDFNDETITSDKSTIDDELVASKGADEELCIIPDTEREISQEEKDAATAAAAAAAEVPRSTEESESSETQTTPSESEGDSTTRTEKSVDATCTENTVQIATDDNFMETVAVVNHTNNSSELQRPDDIKVTEIPEEEAIEESCHQCCLVRKCLYKVETLEKPTFICNETCLLSFRTLNKPQPEILQSRAELKIKDISKKMPGSSTDVSKTFVRKCAECALKIVSNDDKVLCWETMDFCNEDCLSKYQNKIGSHCANCKKAVLMSSLGKYCVRFGHDIRQFCCSVCLEEFKKGLKVCSYCQKDISGGSEGFLAPVGDKGQFKDFCTQLCMEKYDQMSNKNSYKKSAMPLDISQCSVCNNEKQVVVYFEKLEKKHKFCSDPCFVAFKFVNNTEPVQCDMCKKYFENENCTEFSIFYDNLVKNFCCKTCQNIYIIANRRIVPCSWCKVKKYNFDMIKKSCNNGQVLMMCSLNCLSLFQVSVNAVSSKKMKCDHCSKLNQAQYHLTMSDATIRNFCTYHCVMAFQNQFSKLPITLGTSGTDKPVIANKSPVVPAGGPKRYQSRTTRSVTVGNDTVNEVQMPVITNVQSLAIAATNGPSPVTRSNAVKINNQQSSPQPPTSPKPQFKQQVIVKAPPLPVMKNAATWCKPILHTKGVSCRPHPCSKETQTDEIKEKTILVPVPVPIYVPAPVQMFSAPVPVPIPFPLPIPVPIFIPTTRNSAAGIMKEIKKIQVKIPTDPFEAELLMMAEMVAGEKKVDNTDSESEEDDAGDTAADGGFSPEAVDTSNTFGDDMLQMALKMATELDEPAVDLEGALTANTITASQNQDSTGVVATEEPVDDPQPMHQLMDRTGQAMRGRKRPNRQPRNMNPSKRGRRMSTHVEMPLLPPPQPSQPPEPIEKPDANMCLKYTFGVNAWKQWVTTKNAELEKSSRRVKLFKNEILQLTADELNYSLCLFVKEVRKPNGTEYAPDTIYYLCLGIQQYLFENGRIDNIFTDTYYEKFTDCLDEVARKFSVLYNDSHYIVTRVEEEHLWESKQLGAHSPHVLLSTLMFFNTKHFNLTTVDEHMQLSFSHIMKHWKRNPNQPGAAKIPGSRNVLLRFYPPQTTLDSNSRKKKVYEQQENEENPLRCPVKLYEFYLSKCPESVKTRNDVFYLLPERSCVPDSPVWYSTMALGREALEKMLHRVKMVKEINVALLTS